MRPTYETADHLQAEQQVAGLIEKAWDCQAHKLPKYYSADYALCRQSKIYALMEVKCRPNVGHADYKTYILSVHKLIALDTLGAAMDVRPLLVVRWADKMGWFDLSRLLANTSDFYMGGRYDRQDSEDVEPVVYIPISQFQMIQLEGGDDHDAD